MRYIYVTLLRSVISAPEEIQMASMLKNRWMERLLISGPDYTFVNELSIQRIARNIFQDMDASAGQVTIIGTVIDVPPVIETVQSCTEEV